MSNIDRSSSFSTEKGLNTIEISKKLDSVYKDGGPSYRTVANWVAEFKDPERGFEDSPRTGCPSTITTDENIETVEPIVIRDWKICPSDSLRIDYSNNNSL